MIWKLIVAILLMGIGAWGGYALSKANVRDPQGPSVLNVSIDDPKPLLLGPISPGRSLGCNAGVDVSTSQRLLDDHQFKGEVRRGTDKIALKISDDGRSVLMLTANDVSNGATEAGTPLQIISNSGHWILATRHSPPEALPVQWDSSTLLIDTENLDVLWVDAGFAVGLFGQSILMHCH